MFSCVDLIFPKNITPVRKIKSFWKVIHGDFLRRQFGKSFWNEILGRIRELDPTVELAFNDYNMLAGNKGT